MNWSIMISLLVAYFISYLFSMTVLVFVFCFQVKAMIEGRDRRPELGYKLALELRKKYRNTK